MSAETKIWFIYLSDHHEGPFTPEEVALKVKEGVVTAQSLGWKDGMPEWVAIESIPELKASLGGEAAAGGEEGFSLAQMLASQQNEGVQQVDGLTGASSVMTTMVQNALNANPTEAGSLSIELSAAAPAQGKPAAQSASVDPDEEIWTLKVGSQVSGLHSLNRLKEIAGDGDIPPDATLWRKGWSDFQTLAAVPEIAAARKPKKMMGGTKTGITNTNKILTGGKPSAIAPISDLGNDDPTDPNISLPASNSGFRGLLSRISSLIKRRKTAMAAKAMAAGTGKGSTAKPSGTKTAAAKRSAAMGGLIEKIKKIAAILSLVAVLGGGGAAYFLFFSSPIPSDLDVLPDDLESMKQVIKSSDQGQKLFLALARGTEDNPADETSPKFYVAAALDEGADVTLTLTGQPGTLVNRINFQKTYSSKVGSNKMAVFESVNDDGKPLPLGEYDIKVSAEGSEPLMASRFLGGKKSGVYQERLKRYKEKLQGEYDKEMQEMKEFIDTLRSLQAEIAKKSGEYKSGWANAGSRGKIASDWRSFSMSAQVLIGQLDQKVKAKAANSSGQTFHPRAVQDVIGTLGQIQSFLQAHTQRLEGAAPSANPDELESAIVTGVSALDQWLAQALVKSPMDVLTSPESANPPPAGATPPAAAPAAAPQTAPTP